MLHRIKIWIETHPYLTGGLVLLVILYFVLRGRSSASTDQGTAIGSGMPSDAVQQAQIAAGVQSQGIQAASVAASNQNQADIARAQLDADTQVQIASAQRDVALQSILTGGQVALGQQSTDLATAQANIGGNVTIAGIQGDTAEFIAAGQNAVQTHALDVGLQSQQDINSTQIALSGIAADVQKTGIAADLTSTLSGQKYGAQVDLAQINLQTHEANVAAQVENNKTLYGAQVAKLQIQTTGDVAKLQTSDALKLGLSQADLQKYTVGQQADVAKLGITTQGKTNIAYINAISEEDMARITDAYNIQSGVLSGLNAGEFGNANRAALASTLLNPSGTSAQAIEAGSASSMASMWAGIVGTIKAVGGAVFGSGGAGVPTP